MVTFAFSSEKVLLGPIDQRAQSWASCEMSFDLGGDKRRLVQDAQVGEQVSVDQSGPCEEVKVMVSFLLNVLCD